MDGWMEVFRLQFFSVILFNTLLSKKQFNYMSGLRYNSLLCNIDCYNTEKRI